jgi:hypothetical protein
MVKLCVGAEKLIFSTSYLAVFLPRVSSPNWLLPLVSPHGGLLPSLSPVDRLLSLLSPLNRLSPWLSPLHGLSPSLSPPDGLSQPLFTYFRRLSVNFRLSLSKANNESANTTHNEIS